MTFLLRQISRISLANWDMHYQIVAFYSGGIRKWSYGANYSASHDLEGGTRAFTSPSAFTIK